MTVKPIEETDPFLASEFQKIVNGTHEQVQHINDEILSYKPIKKKSIGRNDKCPCGSGKKYKKCCLK